eukprot:gene10933-17047_t
MNNSSSVACRHPQMKKYVQRATECKVTSVYNRLLNEIQTELDSKFKHLFEPSKIIMDELISSGKKVFMGICNVASSSTAGRRQTGLSTTVASIIYLGSLHARDGVPPGEWFCSTFSISELNLNKAVNKMKSHLCPSLFDEEGSSHLKTIVTYQVKDMLSEVAQPLISDIDRGRAHMVAMNISGVVLCLLDALDYYFCGRTSTIFVNTAVAYVVKEHLFKHGVCDDFMTKMSNSMKTAYKKDMECYKCQYFARLESERMSHLLVNTCILHMRRSGMGSIAREIDSSRSVFDPATPPQWWCSEDYEVEPSSAAAASSAACCGVVDPHAKPADDADEQTPQDDDVSQDDDDTPHHCSLPSPTRAGDCVFIDDVPSCLTDSVTELKTVFKQDPPRAKKEMQDPPRAKKEILQTMLTPFAVATSASAEDVIFRTRTLAIAANLAHSEDEEE